MAITSSRALVILERSGPGASSLRGRAHAFRKNTATKRPSSHLYLSHLVGTGGKSRRDAPAVTTRQAHSLKEVPS